MIQEWKGQKRVEPRESLNGAWDFYTWDGEGPPHAIPSGLPWQTGAYPLEALPGSGVQLQAGLLRRRLSVETRAGLRAWLRFERCGGPVVFYLNGRRFFASSESWLPVELDIQDHLLPDAQNGENELVIWRGAGERALQGAEMVYLPAVSIPDLVVRPRRSGLEMEVSLENRTWERFEGRLEVRLVESGQAGGLLAAQEVALERGLLTTLAIRANWRGARFWSLRDPWLHEVEARLVGKAGLLDARRVRFGLREARWEGEAWRLNGETVRKIPASLGEARDLPTVLADLGSQKEKGATVLRLEEPYPGFVLDAADQVGLLVESRVSNGVEGNLPSDPAFVDAAQDHLRRLARRDRSHPSLAAWVLDGQGPDSMGLVEVLRGMDPTRPVLTDRPSKKIQTRPFQWKL